ncbi:hypothetical protein SAMN02787118_1203 [Streptomyces mirabilis]|uniref:Uncharacterized protein n=1 Tax=Streptomyces mirabilis TaxID=68239 RepID=A0A1I2RGP5_9ACTN|nr:hypothetical protein SAMN02787118_1203 [Streptomyces mirabilis]
MPCLLGSAWGEGGRDGSPRRSPRLGRHSRTAPRPSRSPSAPAGGVSSARGRISGFARLRIARRRESSVPLGRGACSHPVHHRPGHRPTRRRTPTSPLPIKEGGSTGIGRMAAPNCPQTHSTSETIPAAPPGPGNGVRKGATGTDGRGAAAGAAATSSSLTPTRASITRSSASPTSVRVTARRRRRVLDRQRQQLLARRADLDTRVHLGPYTNEAKSTLASLAWGNERGRGQQLTSRTPLRPSGRMRI